MYIHEGIAKQITEHECEGNITEVQETINTNKTWGNAGEVKTKDINKNQL